MQIVVTREVITEITGVPHIKELGFPFSTYDFPSKSDMSDLFVLSGSYKHWQDNMNVIPLGNLSHPVKLLAQIVMNNLFSIDHHSNLGVARGVEVVSSMRFSQMSRLISHPLLLDS